MPNLLPVVFIVLGACALVLTLYFLWQSLRGAFAHAAPSQLIGEVAPWSAERAALLEEKHALLVALKDLEAERDNGKMSDGDFKVLNDRYRSRAREVLRKLDDQVAPHRDAARTLLRGASGPQPSAAAPDSDASAKAPAPAPVESAKAAAPASDASAKAEVGTCSACSAPNEPDAVFCKKCGTRLQMETA